MAEWIEQNSEGAAVLLHRAEATREGVSLEEACRWAPSDESFVQSDDLKSHLLKMPGADLDDALFERVPAIPRPLPDLED